ncbi:MAG TPA: NADPH-dependent glutamate synthase [Spirochaetia bacterium]|nr:NADPH-dependent glutamate synthase [Spirochaetia bacterium]
MSHKSPAELRTEAVEILNGLQGMEKIRTKDRLAIPQQEMPAQDPDVRNANMFEVTYGYFEEQARVEAERCLQCRNAPCVAGCPVQIDIPRFIKHVADGDYEGSLGVIKETSLLPSICGRVCPQENQCQEYCTVGKSLKDVFKSVSIGRIERFVADWGAGLKGLPEERLQDEAPLPPSARVKIDDQPPAPEAVAASPVPEVKPATGKKVAVIGSGPASITVAADVRREGHEVTIFEAFHKPGGVMIYGIPEFRLPKKIVEDELHTLEEMGVEIRTNFLVGQTRTLKDLLEKDGYDAVFIGTGAGLPRFMKIPGENLVGVFAANEFLTRSNLMKAYDRDNAQTPIFQPKRVAVLGGGNVAMDAARTAIRIGSEKVYVIYRRSRVEMPARAEEVDHAEEEGAEFMLLKNPTRIIGDENDRVVGIEVLDYELGEPDDSGRRRPVPIEGSESVLDVDTVIVSIGNDSNPLITRTTPELEATKWGNIVTNEFGKTSMDKVFAGGDIVLGAATVILAMGEGRKSAAAINRMLTEAPA